MSVDWSIKFGDILVVVGFVGTLWIYTMKIGGFVYNARAMQEELRGLKMEMQKMSDVLTQLAVQKTRLDAQAERQNLLDARIEDLRKGKGYIVAEQGKMSF